ncbi:MAG: GNAT family N-acetyltransferase [Actinomadura sp.]
MAWFITEDLAEYHAAAGEFLASRPVEHTVPLTVAQTLRLRGAAAFGRERPMFGWWRARDGAVTGAFLHTPPHPVLLTSVPPDVIAPLTETLVAAEHTVAGVNADAAAAEEFAAEWRRLTGASWRLEQRHRLYRLRELIPPSPAPAGAARVAGRADRDLLLAWYEAFVQEAGQGPGDLAAAVDDRLAYGGLTLWEVAGERVSLAGVSRQVAGVTRVAPVYTPPEGRGRGFGGAATAEVSRAALAGGAREVVLFTDLANPTSNALYQRLGYRPVEDRVLVSFQEN